MVEKHHSLRHYRDEHYFAMDNAKSYEELVPIAIEILKSMPQPVGQVCGPLTTGGAGSLKKNLEIFENTVHKLSDAGNNIFNQLPFEKPINAMRNNYGKHEDEKNQILLDRFYLYLFNSGLIKKLYFIHGWQSSHGAKWEREIAEKLGLEIIDLPKDFLDS